MNTKDWISELRKKHNLSQEEMANRLFVTRQAVSRWENGETVPNTETLKLLSQEFSVSINALLDSPEICQSCGASLTEEAVRGRTSDDCPSAEYCAYCYKDGAFAQDLSMEEMIDHNLRDLETWKRETGYDVSPQEAREQLREFLPSLKRWRK